ncbi:hypothetical protein RGQ15_01725 [Paracoccus sp. MBLB3053]|uniref:Acyloxyacyl hydrolase n=1 Tax=Paracoccus aurantius TaxID=3073814 RepID=A0ABU2HNF1_9RHOB|nr:hypothetical protein [Paracoccus sp. MBLB3053]MDS9466292.1 hypothetical protein [Paracoccus sp. MBLB3053]
MRDMMRVLALGAALGLAGGASSAVAGPDQPAERNVFVMTGRMLDESMGASLNIGGANYEDNHVTGIGMQWLGKPGRFVSLGYEAGAAMRRGKGQSTELWTGAVARLRAIDVAGDWQMTPSLVFGLSYVDAVQPGREAEQVKEYDGDASLLFYLSPEIEFSPQDRDWSLFWRLHHRSGGAEILGGMKGAANANLLGFRKRF